jgi:serine/threonine protein kinase
MLSLQDELQRKAALLSTIKHRNIVRFCGVALDPPLLVMEYYRHGSVHSMLEKARQQWGNTLSAKPQLSNDADEVQDRGPGCSCARHIYKSQLHSLKVAAVTCMRLVPPTCWSMRTHHALQLLAVPQLH